MNSIDYIGFSVNFEAYIRRTKKTTKNNREVVICEAVEAAVTSVKVLVANPVGLVPDPVGLPQEVVGFPATIQFPH